MKLRCATVLVALAFACAVGCAPSVPAEGPRAGTSSACSIESAEPPSALPEVERAIRETQGTTPVSPETTARIERMRARRREGAEPAEAMRVEVERLYELSGDPSLLFELAECHDFSGSPATARALYRAYLARVASIPATRRTETEQRIGDLERRVAWIVVRCGESAGSVHVDDIAVAACPISGRVAVDPGLRRVEVRSGTTITCARALQRRNAAE